MHAARCTSTKKFQTLAGNIALEVSSNTNMQKCQGLLARSLNVRPEMVHLIETEPNSLYRVLVCATFKVTCDVCWGRLECACQEDEEMCECVATQQWKDDEELCNKCQEAIDLSSHRCTNDVCVLCSEDGRLATSSLKHRRRKTAKKALSAVPWVEEDCF